MRLYINGNEIDLDQNERINYTKQVNSLQDLASRQANFSKAFKIPATAKNIALFQGLGITGSTSPMPYRKNSARLFLGNICLIYNGWGTFLKEQKENSQIKYFELSIYDGNIDFFKLLDNVKFEDIDLPELSHTKDVATIKSNWEVGNEFYKYLAADFNGETHFQEGGQTYINADYLVPSVPVKYLWERIFQKFGFAYSGSIFQEEEFNNLYLTYPKGVTSGEVSEVYCAINFPKQTVFASAESPTWHLGPYWEKEIQITEDKGQMIGNAQSSEWLSYEFPEDGYYRLFVSGIMYARARSGVDSIFYYGLNQHTKPWEQVQKTDLIPIKSGSGEVDLAFDGRIGPVVAGETITFFSDSDKPVRYDNTEVQFSAEISKVNQTSIDQAGFFKGLSPKDFFKEILWRFGLTPFPAKDRNHIEFLTYNERFTGEIQDWSQRFIQESSGAYTFDGYSKSNYFRFKYNGEEEDFNDGIIPILNENLEEKTDVINSKTYSIEKLPVSFLVGLLPESLPKMELWKKEVKNENGQTVIEYKPRDSRFTFVREAEIVKTVNIGSKELGEYDSATKIKTVANYNYSWSKIIQDRYLPIRSLFQNTDVKQAEFTMTEADFDAFDMKPIIYVEQMGGTFLVNKLSKPDLNQKRTIAELIKINK